MMPPAPTRMVEVPPATWPITTDGRGAGDARHVVVLGQPEAAGSPAARRGGRGRACCAAPGAASLPSAIGREVEDGKRDHGTGRWGLAAGLTPGPRRPYPEAPPRRIKTVAVWPAPPTIPSNSQERERRQGQEGCGKGRGQTGGQGVGKARSRAAADPFWSSRGPGRAWKSPTVEISTPSSTASWPTPSTQATGASARKARTRSIWRAAELAAAIRRHGGRTGRLRRRAPGVRQSLSAGWAPIYPFNRRCRPATVATPTARRPRWGGDP